MLKKLFVFFMILALLLPASQPVKAQDGLTVTVYDQDEEQVGSASIDSIPATLRGYENRVVNGVEYSGPVFCFERELSPTEWRAVVEINSTAATKVVVLEATVRVVTVFNVTSTDQYPQQFLFNSKAIVSLEPSGDAKVQAVAEESVGVELKPGQYISDTIPALNQKTVQLVNSIASSNYTVTVIAKTGSSITGPSNMDYSINTVVAVEFCIFHGGEPVEIGNFGWIDANRNGRQDPGETPYAGLDFTWRGPMSGTDSTDPDGIWGSPPMAAGTYTVEVGPAAPGYTYTVPLAGADRELDSNETKTVVSLEPGDQDFSIDIGVVGVGQVGDRCWLDANNNGRQDPGELGVAGCKVDVLSCTDGAQVASDISDGLGNWLVEGLLPNVPYRAVSTLPEGGFRYALQNVGNDREVDSNPDRSSGDMGCFTLSPETSMEDLTLDVGVIQDNDPYIASKSVVPDNAKKGDVVSYQVRYGNNGPGPATSVRIVDRVPTGLEIVTMPTSCTLLDESEMACSLGTLQAEATGILNYTARVLVDQPLILVNEATIYADGPDEDEGNNDYAAALLVNQTQDDDTPWWWNWLPIINKPVPPDQPITPCVAIDNAQLHVLSKGEEFVLNFADFINGKASLPDGLDLSYTEPTLFWVTVDGVQLTDVQFYWRQYGPFYETLLGLGKSEFVFEGGFPGAIYDLYLTLTTWENGEACFSGIKFEDRVDP